MEIRKCQDFTLMDFPRGACCIVNARGKKGMQELSDLGRGSCKSSDMLITSRAKPQAELLKLGN